MSKNFFVYILQGSKHYVGYTNNLERRISEHKSGEVCSTSKYGKINLIGYFLCNTKKEAIELENKIKKSKNIKRRINYKNFIKN